MHFRNATLLQLFFGRAREKFKFSFIMEKCRVLEMSQAFMARLGIYSYRLTEPINEFFASFSTYYILYNLTFTWISSVTFLYQSSSELKITLQLWLIIIGAFQCSGMFLSVGIKMKQVKALHLKLQGLVDAGLFDCFFLFSETIKIHYSLH